MKTIFSLREQINQDPAYVAAVQARTLDNSSLPGGLKGTYGLFGSEVWWENIAKKVANVIRLDGVITRVYFEGMHNEGRGFEMRREDGSVYKYSCVANEKKNLKRYTVGKKIELIYVVEELKNPIQVGAAGLENYTDTILEISIED